MSRPGSKRAGFPAPLAIALLLAPTSLAPPARGQAVPARARSGAAEAITPRWMTAGAELSAVSSAVVQNVDGTGTMWLTADFYRQGSGDRTFVSYPTPLEPADRAVVTVPQLSHLNTGVFSLVTRGDGEIGTVARTDWPAGGGVAYQNASRAGTDVVVPFVAKRWRGETSFVVVQNTDLRASATAELKLYEPDGAGPIASATVDLPPGTSRTYGLARDPAFARVPNGFWGSLRARSLTPIALSSLLYVSGRDTVVAAFEGIPVDGDWITPRFWVPVVRNQPNRSTVLAVMCHFVVGPSSQTPTATVTYRGFAGACAGKTYTQGPVEVRAGATVLFDQGPGGALLPTGASGLPEPCAASAYVESNDGSLVGTVIDVATGKDGVPTGAAASNAFTSYDWTFTAFAPVVKKAYSARRTSTSLAVISIHGGTSVTMEFYDSAGKAIDCGPDCTAWLGDSETHVWSTASLSAIPEQWQGWAIATARQTLGLVAIGLRDL